MPARNIYHDVVIKALVDDGWTITDDPLKLQFKNRKVFVDLGAERNTIGAAKDGRRIAVEIASFLGYSEVRDLQETVGQYEIYRMILTQNEPDRILFLAVPKRAFLGILTEEFGQCVLNEMNIQVVVFDEVKGKILQWINSQNTGKSSEE